MVNFLGRGWVELRARVSRQPAVAAALALVVLLSLPGLNWGRFECWNLDQMAFGQIERGGLPRHYLKPPLHAYLNEALVVWPSERILGGWFRMDRLSQGPARLLLARWLTVAMYAAMVWLLYRVLRSVCPGSGPGLAALVAATSAGMLAFNRYLSTDVPVTFWMTLSFALAVRAGLRASTSAAVWAGLTAGLATAVKYNGLGVALALPVGLLLGSGWRGWRQPGLWYGALAVPTGFLLGNPGVVLDTARFWRDFSYNLQTTPFYDGEVAGTGYGKFLAAFPELLGWPGSLLVLAGLVSLAWLLWRRRLTRSEMIVAGAASAVCCFYFLTIGRFPRLPVRFVLPVVPLVLVLAGLAWSRWPWNRWWLRAAAVALLGYNIASSLQTGWRYAEDPRMAAVSWVQEHVPPGSRLENSYSPRWQRLPGLGLKVEELPAATGRARLFREMLGEKVQEGVAAFETGDYGDTFTAEALARRNPDYVAFSTQVFEWSGDEEAQRFYAALDRGDLGYRKVFEAQARPAAWWAYPAALDFVPERMVILQREGR